MIQSVFTVANWEFHRYFKAKDQIIGVASLLIGATIGFGAMQFARSSNRVNLAVVGDASTLSLRTDTNLNLIPSSASIDELTKQVEAKQIDGALILAKTQDTPSEIQLIVRNQPTWLGELQPALDSLKSRKAIEAANLSSDLLLQILSPQEIVITSTTHHTVSKADRVVALALLLGMVMVSWLGLAFFMTGITGEKQQRVTEQIVSTISAQSWIDGKLIGLTGAAFASAASLALSGLATYAISAWMGFRMELPGAVYRWDLFPWLAILFLGGALFWNCFYAGVSSIINDPNTSSRSVLLFAPLLPMIASAFAIPQPDGLAMRCLSILPGTSSTAMAIRLMLGEVAWWELGLSIALLVAGVAALRTMASRIFSAGMMLYGKEPSWIDLARYAMTTRLGNGPQ